MNLAEDVATSIEASEWLDKPAYKVTNVISTALELAPVAGRRMQDALHGTWLGHPLHPAAATLPIGTWTLAFGLDTAASLGLSKSGDVARAADIALTVGAAGAVVAAASGMMDWRQVHGRDRRTGLVHAAVNSTALGLTLGSLALRRRGRRRPARALSAAGWLALMGAAWLGGHMVYRRGVGTDHADRSREPRDFVPVIAVDDLEEDRPQRVALHDPAARAEVGIVIVQHRGRVHAMGSRCSHMGGPLYEGWVQGGGLVCPWHGSRYCLVSGAVMNGPSTAPQPRYEVRVKDGMVEVRRDQEPGDEVVTRGDIKDAAAAPMPAVPAGARKADDVLYEHHELLRRLFERIAAMSPDDPERRDMMRVLAGELEIHEHVEDEIFYPAVRAVSEDVSVAHAEHQQLADMLALTLRLGTSSPQFDAHLQALHQAVDHHANSEETSMFVEAQRLGDAHLRILGAQIEDMLDEERENRARRAFRSLKTRLLEGRIGGRDID